MQPHRVLCGKAGLDNPRTLHDALLLGEYEDKDDGVLLYSIFFGTSCGIYRVGEGINATGFGGLVQVVKNCRSAGYRN